MTVDSSIKGMLALIVILLGFAVYYLSFLPSIESSANGIESRLSNIQSSQSEIESHLTNIEDGGCSNDKIC